MLVDLWSHLRISGSLFEHKSLIEQLLDRVFRVEVIIFHGKCISVVDLFETQPSLQLLLSFLLLYLTTTYSDTIVLAHVETVGTLVVVDRGVISVVLDHVF